MVFDYCLLPVIDFNITRLKIFFFFLIFSFFFFVPLHQRVSVFLFFFFFFSVCVGIFSNFSILSFNSHKLVFFEVVYTYNKAQKESLWHKTLFECLLYIPLSFVSTCIRFIFFAYLFLLCVDIFKLCSLFLKI